MEFENRKKDESVLQLKFCGVNISLQNNKIQINGQISDNNKEKENTFIRSTLDMKPTFSTFSTAREIPAAVVESKVIKVELLEEEEADTESDNEPAIGGMSIDDKTPAKVFVARADKIPNGNHIIHSTAVPRVEFAESESEEDLVVKPSKTEEHNHSSNNTQTHFTSVNNYVPRPHKPRQTKPWTEKILSEEYLQKLQSCYKLSAVQREQAPAQSGDQAANQHPTNVADLLQRPFPESLILKKDRKKREGEGTSKTRSIDDVWMKRYEEVKAFKEQHGHFIIPQLKGHQYKVIYNWMNNQRTLYAKGKLSQEKIDKLNELGFVWMTTRKRKRMETAHVKRVKKQSSASNSGASSSSFPSDVPSAVRGQDEADEESEDEDSKHTDANSDDDSPVAFEAERKEPRQQSPSEPQVPEDETGDESMGQLEIAEEAERKEEHATVPMSVTPSTVVTAD